MEPGQGSEIVELPRGAYPARLDDKGRLKMPVAFQKYLESFPDKKLFVTSFDLRIGRIYPISLWRHNEKFLDDFTQEPGAAEDVLFLAMDVGADTEMDSQGRILLPPELRRALNIENQPVKLVPVKGRIDIYSEAQYETRRQRAMENREEKILVLQKSGLV